MLLAYLSDIHFSLDGREDLRAYHFAVEILSSIQPDEIFLGGDVYEHEAVSSHRKSPEAVSKLQQEIDHGYKELSLLADAVPGARMRYYRGNHERRIDKFLLDRAKPLVSLNVLKPESIYRLDDLGIEYIPKAEPVKVGHLFIGHGDEFSTGGVNPADKALNDLNSNILFGHVHRVSTSSKRQLDGRSIVGWSNSCLCDLSPKFVLQPDWTQGFTLVDFTQNGYFSVTPVVFWQDLKKRALCTVLNGTLYDSRKGH